MRAERLRKDRASLSHSTKFSYQSFGTFKIFTIFANKLLTKRGGNSLNTAPKL